MSTRARPTTRTENCVPTQSYIAKIREFGAKYGARRVFIASNAEADVLQQVKRELQGYTVISRNLLEQSKYQVCSCEGGLNCRDSDETASRCVHWQKHLGLLAVQNSELTGKFLEEVRRYVNTYIHTYIHIHTHTHTHTYIYIYI